jgi:hypothetical protein
MMTPHLPGLRNSEEAETSPGHKTLPDEYRVPQRAQMRPRTRRMITMKRMSPTPPVG